MRFLRKHIPAAVLLALAAGGCQGPVQPVTLDTAGVKPSAGVGELDAVLAKCVADDGRLDGPALPAVRDRLDGQLKVMAVAGPTATPALFPTDAARWAYWLNARMAWSIKLADLAGLPRELPAGQMLDRPFPADGRTMTLAAIDRLLVDEVHRAGNFRLAACAAGVDPGSAPLPKAAYAADTLDAQLRAQFERLLTSESRFVIDIDAEEVRVPRTLWQCRDLVMHSYQADTGGADANLLTALRWSAGDEARRRLDTGIGYAVAPQTNRGELALTRPKVYYPGKVGKIE